jgi:hypothetical protein
VVVGLVEPEKKTSVVCSFRLRSQLEIVTVVLSLPCAVMFCICAALSVPGIPGTELEDEEPMSYFLRLKMC